MPVAVLPPIQATTFLPAVVTAAATATPAPLSSPMPVAVLPLIQATTFLPAVVTAATRPWRSVRTVATPWVAATTLAVLTTATATPAPLGSPMPVAVLPPIQATTFLPAVVTSATMPWRSVRTVATPWVAAMVDPAPVVIMLPATSRASPALPSGLTAKAAPPLVGTVALHLVHRARLVVAR